MKEISEQLPMWCNHHNQLEYGPGGPVPSKDHRAYETTETQDVENCGSIGDD